jgi:SAM-dependent methyltransferase
VRFPEAAAGGFTRLDGNVEFYGRVQALLAECSPPTTIVDFGAGRGSAVEDTVLYRRILGELRGPGRTVIGVDVDPVVVDNPRMDEGRVIDATTGAIPIADASVDLVVSDFTFEHVDDPEVTSRELDRILKPGGWICARTPNKWGYIAVGARIVPNRLHVKALRHLQPTKQEQDTFPTRYRLNTRRDLERWFPAPRFEVNAYTMDAESHLYAGSSKLLHAGLAAARHLPPPARSMWMVFIRKAG